MTKPKSKLTAPGSLYPPYELINDLGFTRFFIPDLTGK